MYFYTAYVACAGVIGILEARMCVGDGNQICFVLNFYFHVRVRIRVYIQFSNVCNLVKLGSVLRNEYVSHVCKSLCREIYRKYINK